VTCVPPTYCHLAGACDPWSGECHTELDPAKTQLPECDNLPPTWPAGAALEVLAVGSGSVHLAWPQAAGGITAYTLYRGEEPLATLTASQTDYRVLGHSPAQRYSFRVQAGDVLDQWSTDGPAAIVTTALPPDPLTIAPPLDRAIPTSFASSIQFLYQGDNPVQGGVQVEKVDPARLGLLRGQVTTRGSVAVGGAAVSILEQPELGSTATREDGRFDLVAHGGGMVTLRFAKDGYFPLDRQVELGWNGSRELATAVLTQADSRVTEIVAGASTVQVAQASEVLDESGQRRATLLVPAGTGARMVLRDGTERSLETLHVRATEYTVGPEGPSAMPAELPPSSAYTYAVELSVDEAMAAGATTVEFDQPVAVYVENFLRFPVGVGAPAGYYDRARATWVAAGDGRVISVVSVLGGVAFLDVDGDGGADAADALAALGISYAERQHLGNLYTPGQSLWRVRVSHFTPWDFNCPYAPPEDATDPDPPTIAKREQDEKVDEPDCENGSIIECETQTLGEAVPITGTPFSLVYRSNRVPGRKDLFTQEIPLTGDTLPESLLAIHLTVTVAGRSFTNEFAPAANLTYRFFWDRRDAFGRPVQGEQPLSVRIQYEYPMQWYADSSSWTQSFGRYPRREGDTYALVGASRSDGTRGRFRTWKDQVGTASAGAWDAQGQGLGGWTLDVHHAYDPARSTLYLGDGSRRSAQGLFDVVLQKINPSLITLADVAGEVNLGDQYSATVGADGGVYLSVWGRRTSGSIADRSTGRIVRMARDGAITSVAGGSRFSTYRPENVSPLAAYFSSPPRNLTTGPNGDLYFSYGSSVYALASDQLLRVAGCDSSESTAGDGALATEVCLPPSITALAIGPGGGVYIATEERIRHVGKDGVITTIAGTGISGTTGDGGPALQAQVHADGLLADLRGNLYVADGVHHRVRKISPDGLIETIAGTGAGWNGGDGGPAKQAPLDTPAELALSPSDTLLIATRGFVREIDVQGTITTGAGTASLDSLDLDQVPALRADLGTSFDSFAAGPDGTVYLSTPRTGFAKIQLPPPRFVNGEIVVPSADGSQLYVFSREGRHLRTQDAVSGTERYRFEYDNRGQVVRIVDPYANSVEIERGADGRPLAIVSPYGHRTGIMLDEQGYLAELVDPDSLRHGFTYVEGLLRSFTDRRGHTSTFEYDELGRLERDTNAGGYSKVLRRIQDALGWTVEVQTALGRVTRHIWEDRPEGSVRRTRVAPDGTTRVTALEPDGSQSIRVSEGTTVNTMSRPDPRFGMQAPYLGSWKLSTPAGLLSQVSTTRSAIGLEAAGTMVLSSATTVDGATFRSQYDATTQKASFSTPLGRQVTVDSDGMGRPSALLKPDVLPTVFGYDARGRVHTVTQGERGVTYDYDAQGNLETIMDPLGRMMRFAHDLMGRLKTQTLADGRVIGFEYDANGNVTSVTPPGKLAHSFSYNDSDETSAYSPPPVLGAGRNETSYTYDQDGLRTVTRPDGTVVEIVYDSAGRPDVANHPQGYVDYGYDGSGKLSTMATSAGQGLAYSYDGPLLTDTTWSGTVAGTVHHAYGTGLRLAAQTVNGAHGVSFAYDEDGLLTGVGAMTLARDAARGAVTGTTLGAVTTAVPTFDEYGSLTRWEATSSGGMLLAFDYLYDALGRIREKRETRGGATTVDEYTYDETGRLTDAYRDGVQVGHYEYDSNGNRTLYAGQRGSFTGSYDDQDRMLGYGAYTYTYTANGELETKTDTATGERTSYSYDGLGALQSVTLSDGSSIEYVLDPIGRRIGKKVNGSLVQAFLYQSALAPVAELDASGNVVARYVYATRVNVPDYMVKEGTTYRLVTNHLGSVLMVVDITTGEVVQELTYDDFGVVMRDTRPGWQPFGYAGGQYDATTGLVHFGAREYDAESGRWTTKDPSGLVGAVNTYEYVENDPINWIDPIGLFKLPANPDGLPSDWTIDTTHRDPNGIRVRHPSGDYLDFHKGRPEENRWRGEDHWHHNGDKDHLRPGEEVPDPPPECNDPQLTGEDPLEPNPKPLPLPLWEHQYPLLRFRPGTRMPLNYPVPNASPYPKPVPFPWPVLIPLLAF
jgi:RHS repeat-associated protein